MQEETIQQTNTNWMEDEAEKLIQPKNYEERPSLQLQPNAVVEIEIDFSKPFEEWTGEQGGKQIKKKIIPLTMKGEKYNWWLNPKNPVYKEIINTAKNGQTTFKVLQTGTKADTKYVLVK